MPKKGICDKENMFHGVATLIKQKIDTKARRESLGIEIE
jgi:hypothetical protein